MARRNFERWESLEGPCLVPTTVYNCSWRYRYLLVTGISRDAEIITAWPPFSKQSIDLAPCLYLPAAYSSLLCIVPPLCMRTPNGNRGHVVSVQKFQTTLANSVVKWVSPARLRYDAVEIVPQGFTLPRPWIVDDSETRPEPCIAQEL